MNAIEMLESYGNKAQVIFIGDIYNFGRFNKQKTNIIGINRPYKPFFYRFIEQQFVNSQYKGRKNVAVAMSIYLKRGFV